MSAAQCRKKVLLMGKSGSGKTSMRSIIFANFLARETQRLNPTLDVEHSSVRFLGDLVLSLWDCGGQDVFYESYFESERDTIFRDVELLIYVFDVDSRDAEKDFQYYRGCIEAIKQFSPGARVFCLVHKMDLIAEADREEVLDRRQQLIEAQSLGLSVSCFGTSIWDETLYKAWSSIVYSLIPNVNVLESHLEELATICEADEVVLFERATFLVIAHREQRAHPDLHRFEKVSNIIKQFKLSCVSGPAEFRSMRVRNAHFSAFVDEFTTNTYIMIVTSSLGIPDGAVRHNIGLAREHFESLIVDSSRPEEPYGDIAASASIPGNSLDIPMTWRTDDTMGTPGGDVSFDDSRPEF